MRHHLEIMGLAKKALMEANRDKLSHNLELAMHWRELYLEGHRGPDARHIRARAPTIINLAEILIHAGKLWQEFGHSENGQLCIRLGHHFAELHQGKARGRGREERREVEHLEHLHGQLEELRQRLQRLQGKIREAGAR